MPWNLTNGTLTIEKSLLSEAFSSLFEDFLDQANAITLVDATQNATENGQITIVGRSNIWGSNSTQVIFIYDTTTDKALQIELRKEVSSFTLIEDIFSAINLSTPFQNVKLALLTADPNNGEATIGIMTLELAGELNLGNNILLPWRIEHPENIKYFDEDSNEEIQRPFTLEFPFDESHPAPTLSQVASLFGNDTDPHKDLNDWLPGNVREKPFNLQDLRLTFDLTDEKKLINAEAKLQILEGHLWEIIPGFLSVGNLWIDIEIDNPLDPDYRFPSVEVGGTIKLGETADNGEVLINARWPDYAITGQLKDKQTIEIGAMLQHFHLLETGDTGLENMRISRLFFAAEPVPVADQPKTFTFLLVAEDVWELKHQDTTLFEINQLSLSLQYNSAEDAGLNAQFGGKLTIDVETGSPAEPTPIDIHIEADYVGGQGWQFIGDAATEGQGFKVGKFVKATIQKFLGEASTYTLPENIAGAELKNLHVSFNTESKDFNFSCEADLPLEGDNVLQILVAVNLKKEGENYNKTISGTILIAGLEFDLIFNQSGNAKAFLAGYQNQGAGRISLSWLLEAVGGLQEVPNISIDIQNVLFYYYKENQVTDAKVLFYLAFNAGINLSQLPLVGQYISPETSLNLLFSLLLGSSDFLADANAKSELSKLPGGDQIELPEGEEVSLPDVEIDIDLAGNKIKAELPKMEVAAPTVQENQNNPPPTNPGFQAQSNAPSIQWKSLQKKFGPLSIDQLGLQYENGKIAFLLRAGLVTGPLSIALDGLGVRTELHPIEPEFFLNGLAIEYKSGPIEIGGAFLRNPSPPTGSTFEYDGAALIKMRKLSLAAYGSYAQLDSGHPSMFIYAVLDYPIGGPTFFFVTGLSAGFGYNRSLITPGINQIDTFPLVADVVNDSASKADNAEALSSKLRDLGQWIPPAENAYFLALGIRFSTFKIIDSFALLTVGFGTHFELNILGLSTLVMPTPTGSTKGVTPIAEVQLALRASFVPDDGFLGIEAQLTRNSYILSRNCHLNGGFAFYSWFNGTHSGDFVLCLGGYHKNFVRPSHYPQVPRIGFNWQVTSQLSLKGGMYFALTPSAVMVGGSLEALYQSESGKLRAWFVAGADFLIAWKPYHYDAQIYVDVGVQYTFRRNGKRGIKADLGADLHIWGPDFSGEAEIHLWFVSFTISFGAGEKNEPEAISWLEFKDSFLPTRKKAGSDQEELVVLSAAVENGLISTNSNPDSTDEEDLGIINPKELELSISSAIPNTGENGPTLGLAPLGGETLNAPLQVDFNGSGNLFEKSIIYKEVPAALWGKSLSPHMNGTKVIRNVPVGYKITAKAPVPPEHTTSFERSSFAYSNLSRSITMIWVPNRSLGFNQQEVEQTLLSEDAIQNREKLLTDWGLDNEIDIDLSILNNYVLPEPIV